MSRPRLHLRKHRLQVSTELAQNEVHVLLEGRESRFGAIETLLRDARGRDADFGQIRRLLAKLLDGLLMDLSQRVPFVLNRSSRARAAAGTCPAGCGCSHLSTRLTYDSSWVTVREWRSAVTPIASDSRHTGLPFPPGAVRLTERSLSGLPQPFQLPLQIQETLFEFR